MTTTELKPVSVLITDDSSIVRERLCALCREEMNVRVVGEAATAGEAWELFLERRPAAVVLDIQLPDGSGIELLQRIKSVDPGCLVVMLTNYHDTIFRNECQRLGADHFLCKTTEFEQVAGLLARRVREAESGSCVRPGAGEAGTKRLRFSPDAPAAAGSVSTPPEIQPTTP